MKKLTLFVAMVAFVCLSSSFTKPNVAGNALRQVKVNPFCKFTFVDHRGHSIKLSTNTVHATSKSLIFIFDGGERLIISFIIIRAGHFVAESARSKDPQIIFYPNPGSSAIPMVGAVIISSTKPVSGNFSHLVSDNDDGHLTLVSGSFSF
jgi:hypothetical protein